MAWGFHLILDIRECNLQAANDPETIKAFSKQLVKDIDMIPFGEPMVVHFCEHVEEKAGWTLVQLIETSNIMAHFMDSNGDCYMDVFSCKKFDPVDVINCINKFFSPKEIKIHPVFTRDARSNNLNIKYNHLKI